MVNDREADQGGSWLQRVQPFLPPCVICLGILLLPLVPSTVRMPSKAKEVETVLLQDLPELHPIAEVSARDLLGLLDRVWEQVPGVPAVAPRYLPDDLVALTVEEKKRTFLRTVAPYVLRGRERIRTQRARLQSVAERVFAGDPLPAADRAFLDALSRTYRVDLTEQDQRQAVNRLLRRVDVIPPSMALAQAAIESAWGTSRFARLGNNLFGQWVFDRDKGIAPLRRPEGANYSVARYGSLAAAVDAYLRNLNANRAYAELRRLRQTMRRNQQPLDPLKLADGLHPYSARGDAYIREVRAVIRGNRLTRFDDLELVSVPRTLLTRRL